MLEASEKPNSKYAQPLLLFLPIWVALLVIGFPELIIFILGADTAMVFGAGIPFRNEIIEVLKNEASQELLRHESPLDWLYASTRFLEISLFASLVYLIMSFTNFGINGTPSPINFMLVFSIAFFVMGAIFIVRIWEFLNNLSSKTNILMGKILYRGVNIAVRLLESVFIWSAQAFSAFLFYVIIINDVLLQHMSISPALILYNCTIVLSFIGAVQATKTIIFRFREKTKFWDWIGAFFFTLPWVVLAITALLLSVGIKLF